MQKQTQSILDRPTLVVRDVRTIDEWFSDSGKIDPNTHKSLTVLEAARIKAIEDKAQGAFLSTEYLTADEALRNSELSRRPGAQSTKTGEFVVALVAQYRPDYIPDADRELTPDLPPISWQADNHKQK
jgi:hypothetical protein